MLKTIAVLALSVVVSSAVLSLLPKNTMRIGDAAKTLGGQFGEIKLTIPLEESKERSTGLRLICGARLTLDPYEGAGVPFVAYLYLPEDRTCSYPAQYLLYPGNILLNGLPGLVIAGGALILINKHKGVTL